jgi:predicted component of type VI protein secretion system
MSQLKIALDIANYIKNENVRGKDRIPTSAVLFKKLAQKYSISEEDVKKYITQLKDTHYIFSFFIVHPEPNLYVEALEGFVFAEVSIVNEFRHAAEAKLIQVYESNYYKKKTGFQILKELQSSAKEFNNTALGNVLNEAMALEEFYRAIASNGFEYTDSWRKEKILKLYKEHSSEESNEEQFQQLSRKNDSSLVNSRWTKLTGQFSIEFIVRIHFRKYEFDVVKKLIMQGKITKLKDLTFVRNSLKELETKLDQDIVLKYHLEAIIDLRRLAQAKINILRKSETTIEAKG